MLLVGTQGSGSWKRKEQRSCGVVDAEGRMDGSSSDLVLDLKVAEEKRPPSGWQNPLNHLPSSENFLPSVRDAAVSVIQYSVQPKILLTAGYCVSFAALGLILASLGPVLLDLGNDDYHLGSKC